MDCLKAEMEFNIQFAKGMLLKTKSLSPMVVGIVGNKRYVFPFIHKDDEEKHRQATLIKKELRRLGATAMVFMTEAWFAMVRNPEMYAMGIGERPKDRADRKEALVVSYICKEGSYGAILPFSHIGGEIVFEEGKMKIEKNVEDNLWGNTFKEK